MIKRIVMMEGGVETLSYFSHQMAGEFQKLGYAVFFYDLKQEESSAGKLRKFIRPRETVLVTFNFQGWKRRPACTARGSVISGIPIIFPVIILPPTIRTFMMTG